MRNSNTSDMRTRIGFLSETFATGALILLPGDRPLQAPSIRPTPSTTRNDNAASSLAFSLRWKTSEATRDLEDTAIPQDPSLVVDRLLDQLDTAFEAEADSAVVDALLTRLEHWQQLEADQIEERWEKNLEYGIDGGLAEVKKIEALLKPYAEDS